MAVELFIDLFPINHLICYKHINTLPIKGNIFTPIPFHMCINWTGFIVSIRPTTYFSYRSDALVLPQKENEQKIFRRGEAEAFECVREKRLVNIGVQQKI